MFDSFENSEDPMVFFTKANIDISNYCVPNISTNSLKKKKTWFNDECKEGIKKKKKNENTV